MLGTVRGLKVTLNPCRGADKPDLDNRTGCLTAVVSMVEVDDRNTGLYGIVGGDGCLVSCGMDGAFLRRWDFDFAVI